MLDTMSPLPSILAGVLKLIALPLSPQPSPTPFLCLCSTTLEGGIGLAPGVLLLIQIDKRIGLAFLGKEKERGLNVPDKL
jgi:hypothetical protein